MAEIFEFKVGSGCHFSTAFADRFGATVVKDRIELPERLGRGFIQEIGITHRFSLCFHAYTLKEELILRRLDSGASPNLSIKFDGRTKHRPPLSLFSDATSHEAELGTGNFFYPTDPSSRSADFVVDRRHRTRDPDRPAKTRLRRPLDRKYDQA